MKQSGMEWVKRWAMLAVGLFIMSFGVAFSIKGDLGTSPISSLPYVTSRITGLTVGNMSIIMHVIMILLQICLLRKKYRPMQLLQLPVAVLFGYLTDFAVWALGSVTYSAYWQQWVYCILGILLVGIGVSFEVTANTVPLAGEGVVLAVCQVTGQPFPRIKISFDVTLVALSVILSFVFLHGLYGVREGTVAAALCVGVVSKLISPRLKKASGRLLKI